MTGNVLSDEEFKTDLGSLKTQAVQHAAQPLRPLGQDLNKAVQQEAELALQLKTAEQQKQSTDRQLADWQSRLAQTYHRLAEMKERREAALIEKATA